MNTKENKKEQFKERCTQYLYTRGLNELRVYGRFINLPKPTYLKKAELIREIVSVLCGEQIPQRTKRGAPIKNDYLNQDIILKIEEIKCKVFTENNVIEKNKEKRIEKAVLNFSIVIDELNEKQKQLLNNFLNSL